jgi:hypothetical protein
MSDNIEPIPEIGQRRELKNMGILENYKERRGDPRHSGQFLRGIV